MTSAYELLCEFRRRGIEVLVEGGAIEHGRWIGGYITASPNGQLTNFDRAALRKYARAIRATLPLMLSGSELGSATACYHCNATNRFVDTESVERCAKCGLPSEQKIEIQHGCEPDDREESYDRRYFAG